MQSRSIAAPPGPIGHRWSGNLADYEADRLGFLLRTRDTYGPIVAFDTNTTIVNDPALAVELLDNRARALAVRGNFLNQRVSADDAAHATAARRHLNAGIRRGAVEPLADVTTATVIDAFETALAVNRSGIVSPLPVLESALSQVVSQFYFGADWEPVRDAVRELLDALNAVFGSPFALPSSFPSPARVRIRRRYAALRSIVDPLVKARSAARTSLLNATPADFAAAVAQSAQATDGLGLPRISDLIIGSLLAAQRVPAAGASWAVLEVALDPDLQARVVGAIDDRSSGERAPREMPLLTQVVMETLRLHPPTWLLRRTASAPVSLGGYHFGPAHHFLVSPYVLHRDPTQFPDADVFNPLRWDDSARPQAYLPFGRGQHACPGSSLSTVMLTAALNAIAGPWQISIDPAVSVVADPRSTLIPSGLRVGLTPRTVVRSNRDVNASRELRRCVPADGLDSLGEPLPSCLA